MDRQNTKTVPKTVATTVQRMDRQNTKTSTAIQTERKKKHRETEEEMEGLTASGGSRNRLTHLNLHEKLTTAYRVVQKVLKKPPWIQRFENDCTTVSDDKVKNARSGIYTNYPLLITFMLEPIFEKYT
jgi:hypothetical protein